MADDGSGLTKRLAISKANAQMVAVVAVASFVTIFCLVASNAVLTQYRYEAKVVGAKEKANDQLKQNLENFDKLAKDYKKFDAKNPNIIGGQKNGTGDTDGSNSRIVLDALPSIYDFPGLTSSVEKILTNGGFSIDSIGGTDDQVNQEGNGSAVNPQAVEMPFNFTITNANYPAIQQLMQTLQKSIRPMQVDTIEMTNGTSQVTINAHTFYEPAKSLKLEKKVVK